MTPWAMLSIVAALCSAAPHPVLAGDDISNTPWPGLESLGGGILNAELRPRYNRIDEDEKPERAQGGTYRARLGWTSAPVAGIRFTLEGINTGAIGAKRFNDDPDQLFTSSYPLLPDPRYTGVNQAHADFRHGDVRIVAGRQVVRLDNQRWVSDNDFRQVPQVFDGVRASYAGLPATLLELGHFSRVRTTNGDTQDLRLTTVRGAWNPAEGQSLSAYAIFHDQAANGAFTGFADNSYRVAGLRFEGSLAMARGWDATAVGEVAEQRAFARGDARVRGRYWRAGVGMSSAWLTLRADHEVKGSNAGLYGVQMPLTDFYAWNGWTLHFFNTPREGLRDTWLTARLLLAPGWTLYGEGHRFRTDFGGADLGRELDIGLSYDVAPQASLRLQHARYDGAQPGMDIRKLWLTLTWTQ